MDIELIYDEIRRLWPEHGETPKQEIIDLCRNAVREFPDCSPFWYDLGIIMQRAEESHDFGREDYRTCFEESVRLDPTDPESHQELGFVLDNYFDEFDKAAEEFRKAIGLGGGHESYFGLARVLAEMGQSDQAVATLSEQVCPFHEHPDIQELRNEIRQGIWS